MAQKILKLQRRIEKVSALFLDSVRYSSKTYFLQEIYRVIHERDMARSKCEILEQKVKLLGYSLEQA